MGATTMPSAQNAMAFPRFSGGKDSIRMACESGCRPPPVAPWITRKRISSGRVGARPQRKEKTVKPSNRHQQNVAAAKVIAEPSGNRKHDSVGDKVRGQNPGGFVRRNRKAAGNMLQRDVDHRGVQHLHKGAKHHRNSDDAWHLYGGAGHHGGERIAAAYCGQPFRYPGRSTWVLTSYLVANAIVFPLTGWLGNYLAAAIFC